MRRFSIIVPCYQIRSWADRLFAMLAPKSYADYEVIFVDDCSPDGSYERMQELAPAFAGFRVLQTDENGGPGAARNMGLRHAEGEYILFCDSDDDMDTEALAGIADFLASHPDADMLVFPHEVKRGGRVQKNDTYAAYTHGDPVKAVDVANGYGGPVAKIFHHTLIADNGLDFPPRRTGEDVCFIVRAAACAKNIYKLDTVYYRYLMRRGSLTHSKKTPPEKTTTFEELLPIYQERFPEIEVEQFVCNHLLTRAKQMCAAGYSNEQIRAFFVEENKRYPGWIRQFDMAEQSLYRRLIFSAMHEANPVKIKWVMKLRELLF